MKGITAPLGFCHQSDGPAEITHEVVNTLLKHYYGHITQVGVVCAQSAGLRNAGSLPERGLHFISVCFQMSMVHR